MSPFIDGTRNRKAVGAAAQVRKAGFSHWTSASNQQGKLLLSTEFNPGDLRRSRNRAGGKLPYGIAQARHECQAKWSLWAVGGDLWSGQVG